MIFDVENIVKSSTDCRAQGCFFEWEYDSFPWNEYVIFRKDTIIWCEENLKGNVYVECFDLVISFSFEEKDDMMAFKLRWT